MLMLIFRGMRFVSLNGVNSGRINFAVFNSFRIFLQRTAVVVKMSDMEVNVNGAGEQNDGDLRKRKTLMTQKLQKREDDRVSDIQKKKELKDSVTASNESVNLFLANFTKGRDAVKEGLDSSEKCDKARINEHMDSLVLDVQKLQKYLTDSTMFLPSYDVQRAQETINQLQSEIAEKREALMPKKKFAFKSKKKAAEKPKPEQKQEMSSKAVKVQITECNFMDIKSQTLKKTPEEITEKDVALTRLYDCVVKLYGSPLAIHVNNLTNCKVFSGPVSGSIFVDNCKDCVFVVGCQQLRIHNTRNTNFYIHVTSKAIIEDCQDVYFAPFNWSYEAINEHYAKSGLDRTINNWDQVDDFNWLASDAPSPNWSVLDDDKRVTSWDV